MPPATTRPERCIPSGRMDGNCVEKPGGNPDSSSPWSTRCVA
ncbi:MAG: hypothetical protein JNL10_18475 [Verrucomicrobiales bacterium]|nr:hypothetical protein [Verrucomicrobiales bacterium]